MPKNKNQKTKKQINQKRKTAKKKYKVRNWREYNESLKKRGMLDVYVDECILEDWYAQPNGKRGAQPVYSDLAIQITLQFGKIFSQKFRQTEGLVISLFKLMDIDLQVPDYSTLSRRSENIEVNIPKNDKEGIVAVVDSSGLKVFGEGEWKVRKHGYTKRRTWRKIHLMITPDGEIRAADLTENSVADCDTISSLFAQEEASIDTLVGDGGYDKRKVYTACKNKGVKKIIVPPQRNAKIFQHRNIKTEPHPRDENLRAIRKTSRKKWKERSGYHVRSLSETTMFRLKTIFGDKLNTRKLSRQKTEFLISVSILNKMTSLGMPNSYAIA